MSKSTEDKNLKEFNHLYFSQMEELIKTHIITFYISFLGKDLFAIQVQHQHFLKYQQFICKLMLEEKLNIFKILDHVILEKIKKIQILSLCK